MVQRYPTDLSNTAWTVLAPLIPEAKAGGRTRITDMRGRKRHIVVDVLGLLLVVMGILPGARTAMEPHRC